MTAKQQGDLEHMPVTLAYCRKTHGALTSRLWWLIGIVVLAMLGTWVQMERSITAMREQAKAVKSAQREIKRGTENLAQKSGQLGERVAALEATIVRNGWTHEKR